MGPAPDRAVGYAEGARKLASPLLAVESQARLAEREGGQAHVYLSCPYVRILGHLQMQSQSGYRKPALMCVETEPWVVLAVILLMR